ncbi:hypothetical protein, partial [Saccharomonospora saliphila]|uniref:hypothetical protein n=1 Tax=Saccharomonospora saliphila TaxID=369829 RepID=UPI001E6178FB
MSDTDDVPADPPALDIVDETFLAVPPSTVAAAFADPRSWSVYWPDLVLEVYTDRGDAGLRWTVRGALVGTMEVWLEPVLDGTLLHYFLRARPAGPPNLGDREVSGLIRAFSARGKGATMNALDLTAITLTR